LVDSGYALLAANQSRKLGISLLNESG